MTVRARGLDLDQVPGRWRLPLKLHDRLVTVLSAVHPRLGVRSASLVAGCLDRLGFRVVSEAEIQGLIGPLSRNRCAAIGRGILATALRNRSVSRLVRRAGYESLGPLLAGSSFDTIREVVEGERSALMVFVHAGPLLGIHAALHLLDIPALVMTIERHHSGGSSLEVVADLERQRTGMRVSRARALANARLRLRSGGFVVMALDGVGAGRFKRSLLGRRLRLPGGCHTLSGMTGAPIVPVTAAWTRDGRIAVTSQDAIQAPREGRLEAIEDDLATRTVSLFDAYLRTSLDQIHLVLLYRLLLAPATSTEAGGPVAPRQNPWLVNSSRTGLE